MPVPTPRASLSLVPPLPVHPQDKLQPVTEQVNDTHPPTLVKKGKISKDGATSLRMRTGQFQCMETQAHSRVITFLPAAAWPALQNLEDLSSQPSLTQGKHHTTLCLLGCLFKTLYHLEVTLLINAVSSVPFSNSSFLYHPC